MSHHEFLEKSAFYPRLSFCGQAGAGSVPDTFHYNNDVMEVMFGAETVAVRVNIPISHSLSGFLNDFLFSVSLTASPKSATSVWMPHMLLLTTCVFTESTIQSMFQTLTQVELMVCLSVCCLPAR
jgi:hypothetical protein